MRRTHSTVDVCSSPQQKALTHRWDLSSQTNRWVLKIRGVVDAKCPKFGMPHVEAHVFGSTRSCCVDFWLHSTGMAMAFI